jgi:CheY-like chemotaxis protein
MGKRILIVEDDAHVRQACADVLSDLGHTTVAVGDGAGALAEIARAAPDVILLDLLMPRAKVDGLDFLTLIAGGPAAQTPVIILSALGATLARHMSTDVSAGLNIAAVLPKPVALDTLVQEVNRAERVGLSL